MGYFYRTGVEGFGWLQFSNLLEMYCFFLGKMLEATSAQIKVLEIIKRF